MFLCPWCGEMNGIHQPRTNGLIGIIGATGLEIGLLKKIELTEKERVESGRFFRGHFSGKEFVLVESGIGYNRAMNACIHMIKRFSPSAILSFGLAGSVDMATKIGEILLATHLLWIKDIETLKVEKTYTLDKGLIDIISNILDKYNVEFKTGKVLTVPYFIFKLEERCRIRRELGVEAVEMEGSAIAGEASKRRVPVMALRVISDDISTQEIDYGMMMGPHGRTSLRGTIRFSLVHWRDLLEIFRFARQLRRLGRELSEIEARIVDGIAFSPRDLVQYVDLPVQREIPQ